MITRPRTRTLPLRRWLALALAAVFIVPFLVTGVIVFHLAGVGDDQTSTSAVAERLREEASRWEDSNWQAATRDELTAEGVDFVLLDGGRELYRSTSDPLAGTVEENRPRLAREVTVPGTEKEAFVYGGYTGFGGRDNGPPEGILLAPIVGLTTLLVTLSAIGWLLGRTVVRPLVSAAGAARQMAAGNLDIALPPSRVREVAEVSAALEAMSGGLRESLHEQARLEQERRLFIGAVVHDLRTPLFSLRGSLEGLASNIADTPEKRSRYVAVARDKAEALERLVSDLFDFTRLEYLEQAPNREPLDLRQLLGRLVEGLQPRAETKGVALTLEDAADPCIVEGDSHLLTRALENLLDNALRFTPSGGRVRVACHAEREQVVFSIADTGPGIPVSDLPNLFSPLYRGEISRNRRTGGAGLGLTIARRILLAHGGTLVASNQVGGGAVFTGVLPRATTTT